MSEDTPAQPDVPAVFQDAIQREMAHTGYDTSCADVHITPNGELRECRRGKRHAPPHASGYATRFQTWFDKP